MRIVDSATVNSKHGIYGQVPQPMSIYHSTEEFETNEKNYTLISTFIEFLGFIQQNNINLDYIGLTTDVRYKNVMPYNLWIKTVDKHVPDYADIGGNIHYIVNDQGFIPTDGVYIKCYFLQPLPGKILLFTSAGVNSISITKWEITGAVRTQFLYEKNLSKAIGNKELYERNLKKLLFAPRPNSDMYKFLFAFLTDRAPTFLDLDKSAAIAYGSRIKKNDRYKILQSPIFASAMMQVLKILMPELKEEAKKQFPPEKVIELLVDAAGIAKETKKVSDILAVFDKVSELGYGETQAINDTTFPPIPLVGSHKESPALKPPSDKEEIDKFFDELRTETDTMGAFVMLDNDEEEKSDGE